MIEIIAALAAILSCVFSGIVVGVWTWQKRIVSELDKKAETLNANIEAFTKAYGDFSSRSLEIESQIATLEFKLTGVTERR